MSLKTLLPIYWALEPAERQHVHNCYAPAPPFGKLNRSTLQFELSWWDDLDIHHEHDVLTLDELLTAIDTRIEHEYTCRVTVYKADKDKETCSDVGDGYYARCEQGNGDLLEVQKETYDAHGLCDAINELWRKRGGK